MFKGKNLKWLNLVSFVFLLVASAVFARQGSMFNDGSVMTLFMPAPYAFSIWFLIYILLGIWVLGGFTQAPKVEAMYQDVGYWFALTMVFTGLTILLPLEWTVFAIVVALITALITYTKVDQSDVAVWYRVPFSFLTGWLSVATIVNVSLVLKSQGVTELLGIGEVGWAIIMLAVGTIIAILFAVMKSDSIYPLVFIWGYIAIAVQNSDVEPVARMALTMSIVLGVLIIGNIIKYFRDRQ